MIVYPISLKMVESLNNLLQNKNTTNIKSFLAIGHLKKSEYVIKYSTFF